MSDQVPTPGRIVHYTLSEQDAARVKTQRGANGNSLVGNFVMAGDVYPMVIVRVWGQGEHVNGQVLLDGSDTLWVTSVSEGEGERTFAWPRKG